MVKYIVPEFIHAFQLVASKLPYFDLSAVQNVVLTAGKT